MVLEDLLSYAATQVLRGESVSIRILQAIFALGMTVAIYHVTPSIPLYILLIIQVIITLLYLYFRNKLENRLNEIVYQLINEATNIKSVLDFINTVLFSNRNILDDLMQSINREKHKIIRFIRYIQITLYFIVPSILLSILLMISILIFNEISPDKFLEVDISFGYTLIILSYVLIVVLRIKPIERETSSPEYKSDFQYLATSITEKYTYENLAKGKSIPISLISLMALLFPMPKIEIKTPFLWFGLYMCNGKMVDFVNKMKKSKTVTIDGDIVEFFKCDRPGGAEKWINLQEISLEEAIEKVMGKDIDKVKQSKQILKITIKEDSRPLAYVVMRAWRGCKIHKRLKKDNKGGYKLVIDKVSEWKIISVFMIGVRDHIENLRLRIELATRQASIENILCEEPQKVSQVPT